MARKKTENSPFTKFFKEESQDFLKKTEKVSNELTFSQTRVLTLPQAKALEESEIKEKWKSLRKFFITSDGAGLPKDTVPVHLNPNLLSESTLLNYPVWISQNPNGKTGSLKKCVSLIHLLSDHLNTLYPDKAEGKMVKGMIPRIVMEAANILQVNGYSDLSQVLEKASLSLEDKIELSGSDKETFESQISELKSKIPVQGVLVPYSSNITFKLLHAALSNISGNGNRVFKAKIDAILPKLIDILKVESENDPKATNPEHLKSSMDFADSYLDFNQLSTVIPESASEHISAERYQRIKEVIKTLSDKDNQLSQVATIILQSNLLKSGHSQIKEIFTDFEFIDADENNSCSTSIRIYKNRLKELAEVIKAIRIGELEIDNKYAADFHDDFFSAFDSSSFSEEEFTFISPIVLIADSQRIINEELTDFSVMLHSNIPVNTLALKIAGSDESDSPIDPASLAVSHRNTYVAQMTSLNPQLLFEKFDEGISSYSPSFFHIEVPSEESDKEAFVQLSTSVESRDFPGFIYNGKVGTAWGSRFDISDNPQFEKDWPLYEYSSKNADGKEEKLELPLTFSDYAAIKSAYQKDFMIVEPEFWTDDLALLTDYLNLSEGERYGKVPFIWITGMDMVLGKAAVSWNLVMNTGQKIDFWNYLQDCGGVHSYHAERATKNQEDRIRKETAEEIDELKKLHAAELDKVKMESTEDAMEHLTAALLDIDTEQILTPQVAKAESKSSADTSSIEPPVEKPSEILEEQAETEEELVSEEPWIETPLCTNCNECTDINKRMFNYNADKLAFIADPTAGTFAQLVEAAEKCPVKIIHPGKPLNPEEPDLEDLLKRAAKFS
jgi:ferredoxin